MENPHPPTCPGCEKEMKLTKVVPALAGLPELRSYQCSECKNVVTVPVPRGLGRKE